MKAGFGIANIVLGIGAVGAIFATGRLADNIPNTLSLVAIAVGTIGVSALGFLISKETDLQLAEAHKAAAQASLRAAEAHAAAAKASEDAADSNFRATRALQEAREATWDAEDAHASNLALQREIEVLRGENLRLQADMQAGLRVVPKPLTAG